MKVLVLSCNTGEGHNSTARAIQEYLEEKKIACDVQDALSFLSPHLNTLICGAHVFSYRNMPKAFGTGYRMEEKHLQKRLIENIFSDTEALRGFLLASRYDAVICVHVFSAFMMTSLRETHQLLIPQFFVATDYTCSPGVSELSMDTWFIPHEKLREEFVSCGVPAERIVASGIPVGRRFLAVGDRAAARRSLGMPETGSEALLCCGSMGAGPMEKLAYEISAVLPEDSRLTVVCGTNERLRRELTELALPRTRVVGFTSQMAEYMDAADVYITKAGGLSTTEAVMKRLPLLYVDAVGGCESRNLEFMTRNGYAASADSNQGLAALAAEFLRHPEYGAEMAARRQDFCPDAAAALCASALSSATGPLRQSEETQETPRGRARFDWTRHWTPGMRF